MHTIIHEKELYIFTWYFLVLNCVFVPVVGGFW